MSWILLVLAGLLETAWVIGLKHTEGFSRLWPSVFTVLAMIGSMWLLGVAVVKLPIGSAYAIWVGIGVVGAAIYGVFWLNEPTSAARVVFILMLVTAIVGLKVTSTDPRAAKLSTSDDVAPSSDVSSN